MLTLFVTLRMRTLVWCVRLLRVRVLWCVPLLLSRCLMISLPILRLFKMVRLRSLAPLRLFVLQSCRCLLIALRLRSLVVLIVLRPFRCPGPGVRALFWLWMRRRRSIRVVGVRVAVSLYVAVFVRWLWLSRLLRYLRCLFLRFWSKLISVFLVWSLGCVPSRICLTFLRKGIYTVDEKVRVVCAVKSCVTTEECGHDVATSCNNFDSCRSMGRECMPDDEAVYMVATMFMC